MDKRDKVVQILVDQEDLDKIIKALIPSGIVLVTIVGVDGAVWDITAELHIPQN